MLFTLYFHLEEKEMEGDIYRDMYRYTILKNTPETGNNDCFLERRLGAVERLKGHALFTTHRLILFEHSRIQTVAIRKSEKNQACVCLLV